ncbi:hypothetical protein D3C79_664070 [compost metagenome]
MQGERRGVAALPRAVPAEVFDEAAVGSAILARQFSQPDRQGHERKSAKGSALNDAQRQSA